MSMRGESLDDARKPSPVVHAVLCRSLLYTRRAAFDR
jgi:hypothetical protein